MFHSNPGVNPTNASSVKTYNATSSLVRIENRFSSTLKKLYLAYYNAGAVVVNSEVVGLGPETDVKILKPYSPKIGEKMAFLTQNKVDRNTGF
jgi:hypothetical protein